ncbi:MAG: TIGR00645 family protein [Beijerinckiaceae bacterium]|nr:TIGR00645 family protein [Beijerinckiaceae bacterium]
MTKAAPIRWLEAGLFASRWLVAPIYVGLVVALVALLWVFFRELWEEIPHLSAMKPDDAILLSLSLIDLSLAANLVLIVIYSGYETFVSRIDAVADKDRPSWMGTVDFSGLKMKLIASIIAIAAITLLKAFMKIDEGDLDTTQIQWMVVIQLTFVLSGLLLAAMDYLGSRTSGH